MRKAQVIVWGMFFCWLIGLIISMNMKPRVVTVKEVPKCDTIIKFDTMQISIENIYTVCDSIGLHHKEIIVAQGIIESATFTSPLFKRNNNFLGLYNSRTDKYFYFDHWTDCLIGYRDMIQYRYREGEDYYHFLERIGYAEDSNYVNKVKRIVSKLPLQTAE